MRKVCDKYKITLVGGDTVCGIAKMVSITMLGESKKPVLRSGAKTGDLICVTGVVGGSNAGLRSFKKKNNFTSLLKKKHLMPRARLDVSSKIACYAHSMIDVSDGVASEIKHICEESKKGAVIYAEKIPLCAGASLEDALSGGEDYELLFTLSSSDVEKLKNNKVDFTVIGKIVSEKNGVMLLRDGKVGVMPGGYDHFA